MRIERIVIENINSLSGRFEIDFTDIRYSEGLFAITGPSGAGKTTVLDSICLALYGKTPRIDTISETQDEIMNKNSSGCLAEAVFTSRGKRYKALFSHQRSRGEKPFRPVKREIWEYNADGTANVAAAAIKEANEKIVEITGLNYSQFTRSTMLAQFKFAEFLKADSNERAALLEQVSDMEIYRDISAAVYERAKREKETLGDIRSRMQALKVLDEAQIQSLEDEERGLAEAVRAHGALRDRFSACRDAAAEIKKLGKELEGYAGASAVLADAALRQVKLFDKAEADEKEAKRALFELQKTLKAVRELDHSIASQNSEIKRLDGEAAEANGKIKARKKELKALFLKYFPNAGGDELKALYESQKAGDSIRAEAKSELDAAAAARDAVRAEIGKALKGKDEAFWQGKTEVLRIALAVAEAREAAQQAANKIDAQKNREREFVEVIKALEGEEKTSDERLVYARLEQRFGEERRKLEEGKPCPLCGSTEHPDAGRPYDAKLLEDALRQKEDVSSRLKSAREELAAVKKAVSDLEALIKEKEQESERKRGELERLEGEYNGDSTAEQVRGELEQAEHIRAESARLLKRLSEAAESVARLSLRLGEVDRDVAAVEGAKRAIADIEAGALARASIREEAAKLLQKLKGERFGIFGEKNADAEEAKAAEAAESAGRLKDGQRERKERAERDLEQNKKDIARTKELTTAKREALKAEYSAAKNNADAALVRPCFEDDSIEELFTALKEAVATLGDSAEDSAEKLGEAARISAELASAETARRGALGQMLADNARSLKEMGELKKGEKKQAQACAKWDRLNALIGSADGIKFSRMAQGYTFEALLKYANACLKRMTDRYVLVRDISAGKPLELAVADNYQAGDRRPVSNLSGGESFIVSMALALGMSEMSSGKTSIDSLFIDEGFASLDDDYLEAALQTLSALGNREGKLVGVISHVSALKERIDAQIEVRKLSGGRSTLSGPGVRAAGE